MALIFKLSLREHNFLCDQTESKVKSKVRTQHLNSAADRDALLDWVKALTFLEWWIGRDKQDLNKASQLQNYLIHGEGAMFGEKNRFDGL
jgi:hypothetical protein